MMRHPWASIEPFQKMQAPLPRASVALPFFLVAPSSFPDFRRNHYLKIAAIVLILAMCNRR
jgi:hypothetical protein